MYYQNRIISTSLTLPVAKGTRWNLIGLGLKFVYLISLTKKYVMDPYRDCTISYQTCITTISLALWMLQCRRASVRARDTR